jgi:hypothetical protein
MASCECGFGIELGLPALDSFVADLFATGLDGFDSKAMIIWNMFAVIPSVICSMRRRDFGVKTVGGRNGVLRRIEATNVSNCSFAAHLLRVSCSKRRANWTSPPIASRASLTPKQTSEI